MSFPLVSQHPDLVRGFRHVDDYELSFVNLSDAEKILTALQGVLAEYELFLNPLKTQLCELPIALEDNWSIDLRTFEIRHSSAIAQRNDITALVSKALEIASEQPKILCFGMLLRE